MVRSTIGNYETSLHTAIEMLSVKPDSNWYGQSLGSDPIGALTKIHHIH